MSTQEILKSDLEALKYLINYPNLYLYDYFSELRRSVDLAAAEKLLKSNDNLLLIDQYIDIIERINLFEKNCLQFIPTNEFNSDIKADSIRIIQLIEFELDNSNTDIHHIHDLIYEETYKLKNILFLNQTIEFIQENNSEVTNLFSLMDTNVSIGKLVIVKNQYFSTKGLSLVTKYFFYLLKFLFLKTYSFLPVNIQIKSIQK